MNASNVCPIEVGDRADAPMPFGGTIFRGTVVDITHPTAILDLDAGGRVSVMVDTLRPVDTDDAENLPYECPDFGDRHDGMTTGTERCPDCENE